MVDELILKLGMYHHKSLTQFMVVEELLGFPSTNINRYQLYNIEKFLVTFRVHFVQRLFHVSLCRVKSKGTEDFSKLCWLNFSISPPIKEHKSFFVF